MKNGWDQTLQALESLTKDKTTILYWEKTKVRIAPGPLINSAGKGCRSQSHAAWRNTAGNGARRKRLPGWIGFAWRRFHLIGDGMVAGLTWDNHIIATARLNRGRRKPTPCKKRQDRSRPPTSGQQGSKLHEPFPPAGKSKCKINVIR